MRTLPRTFLAVLVVLPQTKPAYGESSIPLFPYERDHLQAIPPSPVPQNALCKTLPEDPTWPSEDTWNELNDNLKGALLKPAPLASVCYTNTTYNNFSLEKCQNLTQIWGTGIERAEHPIEVNSIMYEGLTCVPTTDPQGKTCRQGGYPIYVVNVTTVSQIQTAIAFARTHNIRLVIKNTSHDFSGRTLGAGALSIWTHHLKDITHIPEYTTEGYTGPAFKVGAGVQAQKIYKVAYGLGLMVVGGVCDSVGLYGGYSLGGGHSMLSSLHGLGADQILSLQLVLPSGQFITASPSQNQDLFWAVRGGGASTFGIVTSMIVKAFPEVEVSVGSISWNMSSTPNMTPDIFWAGVRSYFSYFSNFTSQGASAQWNIYPHGSIASPPSGLPAFEISQFFAPIKSLSQTREMLAPFLSSLKTLGLEVTTSLQTFPSYYEAYYTTLPPSSSNFMPTTISYASRLIPRQNFHPHQNLNETIATFRTLAESGHFFNGYQYSPTLSVGKPVGEEGNAIHPAWRIALSHTIIFLQWDENTTAPEQLAIRKDFAEKGMKGLRDVTRDGGGSYMNEADRLEPEWQESFYGDNYEKLLEIKKRYDPEDVFWVVNAVGSEGWSVKSVDGLPTEDGPLCRVSK